MFGQSGWQVMSDNDRNVNAQFAELQREYIANLPERVAPIFENWQHYIDSEFAPDLLKMVYRGVHAIAGTSGILNLSPIDSLSNTAQIQIHALLQADDIDLRHIDKISQVFKELQRVVETGAIEVRPMGL